MEYFESEAPVPAAVNKRPPCRGFNVVSASTKIEESSMVPEEFELTFFDGEASTNTGPFPVVWKLRASNPQQKSVWLKKIRKCVKICEWLTHYEMGRVLGVGGNGIVSEFTDKRNNKMFAIKEIVFKKASDRQYALQEVEIMKSVTNNICHPNLVSIYHVYEQGEKFFMVMDMCKGGELYDRIVAKKNYGERDAALVMKQLASALRALHAHNILHLDIKPENILYQDKSPESEIKITDFGLSRVLKEGSEETSVDDRRRGPCGTVGYLAPEVITQREYSPACDVWAAGVVLYVLLMGYPPFYGADDQEILEKTVRGQYPLFDEDWAPISPSARSLVCSMLKADHTLRITLDEVLDHPWLKKFAGDRDSSVGSTPTTSNASASRSSTTAQLSNAQQRLLTYNTERKTRTVTTALTTVLDGISFTNSTFNETQLQALQQLFMSMSKLGDGKIDFDGFCAVSEAVGEKNLLLMGGFWMLAQDDFSQPFLKYVV
jgi:serine/threonine protein kinase